MLVRLRVFVIIRLSLGVAELVVGVTVGWWVDGEVSKGEVSRTEDGNRS